MKKAFLKNFKSMSPGQKISLGFAFLIAVGMILLALPISSADGQSIGILDALFTSTSGVCVTGLTVINTGAQLSLFGQIVLIALIQMGGLGFMLSTFVIYIIIKKKITLSDRMTLRDSLNEINLSGIVNVAKNAVKITAIFEICGAVIFCFRFIPEFGWQEGVFVSVFQSISAFCNAGFDIFVQGTSLVEYADDVLVNITTMALIIGGGIGYIVIAEITECIKNKRYRFTLHTKIVLIFTAILTFGGFIIFFVCEYDNPATMGNMDFGGKVMASFFQSVTTRTAGFASVDQGALTPVSKIASTVQMFIGASPGGTGGGIKTTTFAVIVLFCISVIKGKRNVVVNKKSINRDIISRAIAIAFIYISMLLVFTIAVYCLQNSTCTTGEIVYELVSALSTVGLTAGITPLLTMGAKIVVIAAMFIGRVGMLTITFAIAQKNSDKYKHSIKYPEDKIIIG